MKKKILIVVAHPDDEILGAGGYISTMTSFGNLCSLCILSGQATARNFRPSDSELLTDMNSAAKCVGISEIMIGDFTNIEFNIVPHIKLVQFIEKAIIKFEPDIIITNHPNDLNNDHFHTSLACQTAIRIFQRKPDLKPIEELLFMEVPSSTEWSVNESLNQFRPNIFFEIGEVGLRTKLQALNMYRGVLREYPHPRSEKAITGLAAYRGAQAGLNYAEAFQLVFKRVSQN